MIDQEIIERVAAAIDRADTGFRMTLTRLVDGVHTYELEMDGTVEEFEDTDDLYARVREVKQRKQAEAVIAALANPSPEPHVVGIDTRALAVEIVDQIHGYTYEHSHQPHQHLAEYDQAEWCLKRAHGKPTAPSPSLEEQPRSDPRVDRMAARRVDQDGGDYEQHDSSGHNNDHAAQSAEAQIVPSELTNVSHGAAPSPQANLLDKPAQVGSVKFRAGISHDTVIQAAQRLFEASQPAEAQMEGLDIHRLPVGTPVTKVLGYPFPGTVVAAFHTLSGQERFVVEATGEGYRGMLHIFNGDQLRALAAPASEGFE